MSNRMTIADHTGSFRAEARLLLCCARQELDDVVAARLEDLLQQDLDWTYVLKMGWIHGLRPLLYAHLGSAYATQVPPDALDQLRRAAKTEAAHNLLLSGELLKIMKDFQGQGLEALSYKGPIWAMMAYGTIGLRPFVDLDILVRRRDVLPAGERLATFGYHAKYLPTAATSFFLRYQYNEQFHIEKGDRLVELHWAVLPNYFAFSFDTERFWERATTVALMDVDIPTLSPEDALLIHCAHGAKHYWNRLEWIVSLAAVLQAGHAIDWAALLVRAEEMGGTRMLSLGFHLAHELLDVALPGEVQGLVERDAVAAQLAAQVAGRLFDEDLPLLGSGKTFFHMRARERVRDKVRYGARFVMQPSLKEMELMPLPTFLFPLYYIVKPLRLFGELGWKHLKHLWSRVVRHVPA